MDTQDKPPGQSYTIYHDLQIKSAAKNVFQAISDPDHLINWWPLKCTGNPEIGSEYNFYFSPEYDWYGIVSECKRDNSFHIKMTQSDKDWDPTIFGFDLSESENQTQVRFFHKNWPECNEHFRIASFCWAMLLKGLKDYVEKGIILPFEERS